MIRPGSVVKAKVVGVDFGKLTFKPGDYGIVCDTSFEDGWFGVHWHVAGWAINSDYMCHVGPADVEEIDDNHTARIFGGNPPGKCMYCEERHKRRSR